MRLPKICIMTAVVGVLLGAVAPALAQPYFQANMALNPETQKLYLSVKTNICGFAGYFTITPESLVVPGYSNQIACDTVCYPNDTNYVCMVDFEIQVVSGLEIGDSVTFDVQVFQSDGQFFASVDDELFVQAGPTRDDPVFGYRDDCVPDVPSAVERDESYCLWLCHRTYIIPIITPPPIEGMPVFRIRPGCDQYIPDPYAACAVDTCSNNANEGVLSWHVTVINPMLGFLVIIYCDAAPGCACLEGPDYVLPVELSAFNALAGNGYVDLSWTTASELDNSYFNIWRRAGSQDWLTIAPGIPGHGTTAEAQHYSYRDGAVINDVSYEYRLESVDINGERHTYDRIVTATPHAFEVPVAYELAQNFPNPFNSITSFEFALPEAGHVTLKIHDILGREIATVIDGNLGAQRYRATWNAEGLSSGVYLYTLDAGAFTQTRKMLFVK